MVVVVLIVIVVVSRFQLIHLLVTMVLSEDGNWACAIIWSFVHVDHDETFEGWTG